MWGGTLDFQIADGLQFYFEAFGNISSYYILTIKVKIVAAFLAFV